ncbi:hypothetical protein Tco_0447732 [Tanacetum coccineum]
MELPHAARGPYAYVEALFRPSPHMITCLAEASGLTTSTRLCLPETAEDEDEVRGCEEEEEPLARPICPTTQCRPTVGVYLLRSRVTIHFPSPLPPSIVLPHTKASMAMMRAVVPSTYILAPRSGILPSETPPSGIPPLQPIPLPTLSPPLLLPSTDCRFKGGVGVFKVTFPPQKRLCITLGLRFEVGESHRLPLLDLLESLREIMVLLPPWMMRFGRRTKERGCWLWVTTIGMSWIDAIALDDKTARKLLLLRNSRALLKWGHKWYLSLLLLEKFARRYGSTHSVHHGGCLKVPMLKTTVAFELWEDAAG